MPKDQLISTMLAKGDAGLKVLISAWTVEPQDQEYANAVLSVAQTVLPVLVTQGQLSQVEDLLASMACGGDAKAARNFATWLRMSP